MLYVMKVDGDTISVADTKDAVVEDVSRHEVMKLIKRGIEIIGVSSSGITALSDIQLDKEFMHYTVRQVDAVFRKSRFRNDNEIFTFLSECFRNHYNSVHYLLDYIFKITTETEFIAEGIYRICRIHGINCNIEELKDANDIKAMNLVFDKERYSIYAGVLDGKKCYRVVTKW